VTFYIVMLVYYFIIFSRNNSQTHYTIHFKYNNYIYIYIYIYIPSKIKEVKNIESNFGNDNQFFI